MALIVKRCAKDAGLDPKNYADHSLRSGLATAAAMVDVSELSIMAHTGHNSLPWSGGTYETGRYFAAMLRQQSASKRERSASSSTLDRSATRGIGPQENLSQISASLNRKFAVDVAEVILDRLGAQEQGGRRLTRRGSGSSFACCS